MSCGANRPDSPCAVQITVETAIDADTAGVTLAELQGMLQSVAHFAGLDPSLVSLNTTSAQQGGRSARVVFAVWTPSPADALTLSQNARERCV